VERFASSKFFTAELQRPIGRGVLYEHVASYTNM
jgi:hypothetical protein